MRKTIIIVGGGFGGVRCALDLARAELPENTRVVLLSDKPHFEYTPSLYKVATGRSPLEVCIPLREIFNRTRVEVCAETVIEVNSAERSLTGASGLRYSYDFLVLAVGSETTFFGIDELRTMSFSFKTLADALQLNWHLAELFKKVGAVSKLDETVPACQIVVIGGGSSGVELSGAIAEYRERAARGLGFDPSLVTVNLIESSGRILASLPKQVADRVTKQLNKLGVNITLNHLIKKKDIESDDFFRGTIASKTLISTAGVSGSALYKKVEGLSSFDKRGRAVVDRFLQARGLRNVFIIGDGAATRWSGMAQTAIHDGQYAARVIESKIAQKRFLPYQPKKPVCIFPVGNKWAAVIFRWVTLYGAFGWLAREIADFGFFLSILPFSRAFFIWRNGFVQKVENNNTINTKA